MMQTATVVRIITHTNNVQLLCSDDRGLLSVYFEQMPFISFYRLIKKAGLKLAGLKIEFNHDMVWVPAIGKTCEVSASRRRSLWSLFRH